MENHDLETPWILWNHGIEDKSWENSSYKKIKMSDNSCDRCGKSFKFPYLLKNHKNRKFPCQITIKEKNIKNTIQILSKNYPKTIQKLSREKKREI